MPDPKPVTTEFAQPEVRTLTTVEYGLRDFGGEVVPMPEWQSDDDINAAIERHQINPREVVVRTTRTTTTAWEAAR